MTSPPPPDTSSRARLAAVIGAAEPAWADSRAGRLVERWLPGGPRGVAGARALAGKHRFAVAVAAVVLAIVIATTVIMSARQPVEEAAPSLPPAISAGPTTATTSAAPSSLVVSVVGRVGSPGLVTLPVGSRVADAVRAAGGALPRTNDLALNLARRLSDGEQIYVGIAVPAGASVAPPPADPAAGGSAAPGAKIDLNTATDEQLQTLPGVGPAMSQHILTWRTQHGHFDSIGQLRDVDGIGDGRYAKLKNLVTT
jgi:competence protein ComEA